MTRFLYLLRFYFLSVILFFLSYVQSAGQIGGKRTFELLRHPSNARIAGLGGINVSLKDKDVNLIHSNPATLDSAMTGFAAINYNPFRAGIHHTSLGYAHHFGKIGTVGMGLLYTNYGSMNELDAGGNQIGQFSASDFVMSGSYGHEIGNFSIGATCMLAGSYIAEYNSYATAINMGAIWKHPSRQFTVGLAVKNLGFKLNRYQQESLFDLPFDVQLGTSYKLEHLPVRFSITAHHLHRLDIVYLDPNTSTQLDAKGNPVQPKKSLGDKILRHFTLGGEILLSKNFHIRAGYNHLLRREMRLENASGGAGFSVGAMLRIKSFELGFTRGFYHAAGGTNFLSLIIDFNRLTTKQTTQTTEN
jgi:hypothetical protein